MYVLCNEWMQGFPPHPLSFYIFPIAAGREINHHMPLAYYISSVVTLTSPIIPAASGNPEYYIRPLCTRYMALALVRRNRSRNSLSKETCYSVVLPMCCTFPLTR